jgi:mRNA-degrading endonuclease YafQ of YafQ-DinJ toxin-antitoxin module
MSLSRYLAALRQEIEQLDTFGFRNLSMKMRHPSLHTKKIKGREGIWETRIDLHYRLTFEIIEDTIFLRVTGSHDEVLRNP